MPALPLMDKSLDGLIVAICADYDRRRLAIEEKALPRKVLMEYKYLNLKILEGAMEAVGVRDAKLFIDDIGERRGYAKSDIDGITERIYKIRKARAKVYIAKKLSLLK